MKKETTKHPFKSYKLTNFNEQIKLKGTCTLDGVNSLKKKVNKLIKQRKKQIQNVFEHCWNHPNWKGDYDIKDMNDYINQNK